MGDEVGAGEGREGYDLFSGQEWSSGVSK